MKDQSILLADIISKQNIHIFAEIGVWKFKTIKKLMIQPAVIKTIKEYWAIDPYIEMPQYRNRHEKAMDQMQQNVLL